MSENIRKANGDHVGKTIKRLSKEKGMTLAAVAKEMGKSRQYMSDIIANRRMVYPAELVEVSKILETTPNMLLGFKEPKEILVTYGEEREVIVSITDENVIFKEGYEVTIH